MPHCLPKGEYRPHTETTNRDPTQGQPTDTLYSTTLLSITYNLTMPQQAAEPISEVPLNNSSILTNNMTNQGAHNRSSGGDGGQRGNEARFHAEFDSNLNGEIINCAVCTRKRNTVVCVMSC